MTPQDLMNYVVLNDAGCWIWQGGHLQSGYGAVRFDGQSRVVHKVMWELTNGAVPPGLQLDHLCRVRDCCRPDHLEPVTQAENLRRGEGPAALNARKTTCPRGHQYDQIEANGGRECSICKRARRRAHYIANSVAAKPAATERTHCPSGHEYTPENTYIRKNGHRSCRTCRVMHRAAYYALTAK